MEAFSLVFFDFPSPLFGFVCVYVSILCVLALSCLILFYLDLILFHISCKIFLGNFLVQIKLQSTIAQAAAEYY